MERRDFLERGAATAVTAWAGISSLDMRAAGAFAASALVDAPYELLTPAQVKLVDAITAQIIPSDDTPGAREAHAVRFIDRALATFAKGQLATQYFTNLDAFLAFTANYRPDNKPFVECSSVDQIAALQDYERMRPQSFRFLRNITMTAMFSNPRHGGNFNKIGWRLIGFEDRYSWAPPFGYYDRG